MSYRKDTDFDFEPTKDFSHIYNLLKTRDFISRTRIENYGGLAAAFIVLLPCIFKLSGT